MADLNPPVRFDPSVEHVEDHEAATIRELTGALREIQEITARDEGRGLRGVHAKSHALVEGVLEIAEGLPPELAQGLFATPGRHDVLLRFSTNPGDILDDDIRVPRGLAIKVLDVEGDRLEGAEGRTQDFVLVNGPAFATPGTRQFLANLKLLAKTTDKAEWAKKGLSAVLRGAEAALEAVGGQSPKLVTLGGAPNVHPLGATYFSQTPFRFGDHIAKFSVAPVSENVRALTGAEVDLSEPENALRRAIAQAAGEEWVYALRVQLCRDLEAMPIEDASVVWNEETSPFATVATVRVSPQETWTYERSRAMDDGLRFSIWTGIAAHQPLGQVNRARKAPYEASAQFRAGINGCPIHEPDRMPELA